MPKLLGLQQTEYRTAIDIAFSPKPADKGLSPQIGGVFDDENNLDKNAPGYFLRKAGLKPVEVPNTRRETLIQDLEGSVAGHKSMSEFYRGYFSNMQKQADQLYQEIAAKAQANAAPPSGLVSSYRLLSQNAESNRSYAAMHSQIAAFNKQLLAEESSKPRSTIVYI